MGSLSFDLAANRKTIGRSRQGGAALRSLGAARLFPSY